VKVLLGAILCALIGLAALVEGVDDAVSDVKCGSRIMVPGETCAVSSGGRYHRHTVQVDYEQQRAAQRTGVPIKIGAGVFLLGFPALGLVALRRRRSAERSWTGN
jgi:hypothetical protein